MTQIFVDGYAEMKPITKMAPDQFYPRLLKEIGAGKVLDVGCGRGYVLSRLELQPKQGRFLYGIDGASTGVGVAQAWTKSANISVGDVRKMNYESDTFDYLICTEVLEHFTAEDCDAVVRECYRVVKPGGTALFTVPNGKGVVGGHYCAHIRFFSFGEFVNTVKGVGFEVLSGHKFGLYVPCMSPVLRHLYDVLGVFYTAIPMLNINLPEFLSASFFIKCHKPT